jgi:hypothetical protein
MKRVPGFVAPIRFERVLGQNVLARVGVLSPRTARLHVQGESSAKCASPTPARRLQRSALLHSIDPHPCKHRAKESHERDHGESLVQVPRTPGHPADPLLASSLRLWRRRATLRSTTTTRASTTGSSRTCSSSHRRSRTLQTPPPGSRSETGATRPSKSTSDSSRTAAEPRTKSTRPASRSVFYLLLDPNRSAHIPRCAMAAACRARFRKSKTCRNCSPTLGEKNRSKAGAESRSLPKPTSSDADPIRTGPSRRSRWGEQDTVSRARELFRRSKKRSNLGGADPGTTML